MTDLKQILTSLQVNKLNSIGINSVYDLITLLPLKLESLNTLNFNQLIQPNQNYFFEGVLEYVEVRKKIKTSYRKLKLSDSHSGRIIECYFFGTGQYLFQNLQVGRTFQAVVALKKDFWQIKKIAVKNADESKLTEEFILGRARYKNHLVPIYSTTKGLGTGFFSTIHRRLPTNYYQLNLTGLVPENSIIPPVIDLIAVHKPISEAKYYRTRQEFLALKVFLKLASFKILELSSQNYQGLGIDFEKDLLSQMESRLSYQLTKTQKLSIWEILSDLN